MATWLPALTIGALVVTIITGLIAIWGAWWLWIRKHRSAGERSTLKRIGRVPPPHEAIVIRTPVLVVKIGPVDYRNADGDDAASQALAILEVLTEKGYLDRINERTVTRYRLKGFGYRLMMRSWWKWWL